MRSRKGLTGPIASAVVIWIVRRLLGAGRKAAARPAGRNPRSFVASVIVTALSAAVVAAVEFIMRRGVTVPAQIGASEPDFDIFSDDDED